MSHCWFVRHSGKERCFAEPEWKGNDLFSIPFCCEVPLLFPYYLTPPVHWLCSVSWGAPSPCSPLFPSEICSDGVLCCLSLCSHLLLTLVLLCLTWCSCSPQPSTRSTTVPAELPGLCCSRCLGAAPAAELAELAGLQESACPRAGAVCAFVLLCWFCFLVYVCLFIIVMLTFVLQLHSLVKRSFLPGTAQGRHWS